MNFSKISWQLKQVWLLNEEYLGDQNLKEQIQLTNVEYLWLSHKMSWTLVFCVDTHMCTISKVIGINEEKLSAKQGIHKQPYTRKNRYGCQMHGTYAYYY